MAPKTRLGVTLWGNPGRAGAGATPSSAATVEGAGAVGSDAAQPALLGLKRTAVCAGRPPLYELLVELQHLHSSPPIRKIGLFACGPKGLNAGAEAAAAAANRVQAGPRYAVHTESFER